MLRDILGGWQLVLRCIDEHGFLGTLVDRSVVRQRWNVLLLIGNLHCHGSEHLRPFGLRIA